MTKLLGDYSDNIGMPNVNQLKYGTAHMIFYSVFFINRKLFRAEVFSKILTNLPKEKLEIIKLNY